MKLKKIIIDGQEIELGGSGEGGAYVKGDTLYLNAAEVGSSSSGTGGIKTNTVEIAFNPTDYPLPETDVITDYTITNVDVINKITNLVNDYKNNNIKSFMCGHIMSMSLEGVDLSSVRTRGVRMSYDCVVGAQEHAHINIIDSDVYIKASDMGQNTDDIDVITFNNVNNEVTMSISLSARTISFIRDMYGFSGSYIIRIDYIV